ncbi:MAG: tripartite tricarboxylate transporter TctB family protein [Dysosmobacter sp.]|nr:tripartite tricarboxylate transporter TctB family protein [Dysosmobacter sp.]
MKRDQVTGAISIVLGVLVVIATIRMPASGMRNDVGPKVFPAICAAGLILSGIGVMLKKDGKQSRGYTKRELGRLLLIGAVVLGYVILMNLVGFLIPTVVVLYIMSTMFAEKLSIPRWKRALFAVAVTAAIYVVFVKVMALQLPGGRLF